MAETFAGFRLRHQGGLPVLWRSDDRFKTLRVTLQLRRPLDPRAAARSLLPGLLLQGTAQDPDRPALSRRMESLYGAAVLPGTEKIGEVHGLRMTLDVVAGRFLPGHPDQLGDGLRFLAEQLVEPRLAEGAAFPSDVFERERDQAVRHVETLIDDRGVWASLRALQLTCAGEPMALPEYGGLDELRALTPGDPELARQDFLQHGEAALVACGALEDGELARAVDAFLARLPARAPEAIGPPVEVAPRPAREFVEAVELQQAKLVLILRTPWTADPDVWLARRLFVAMLGGGPHSRLFREVREARSLAYYAQAALDRHKGLLTVRVGLDAASADAVVEECERQRAELAAGRFTDDELEVARAHHLSAIATVQDSVAGMTRFVAEHWTLGLDRDPEGLAERYRQIGRDDVVASMAGTWLDARYLLAPRDGRAAEVQG
ncbi:MAG: insulinase family protein [Planctomycetes bacterium]|nr:insulinase family protein [Planctomycetota bacterium]